MSSIPLSWQECNKDAYNTIAKPYARTRRYLLDELTPLFSSIPAGSRVLDVGCGAGRVYHALAKNQVQYTGVDQSEKQLDMAKEMCPNGTFLEAEITLLPFPNASCDVVCCIAALHHLETPSDRKRALAEMYRVLIPGGIAYLTNWDLSSDWVRRHIESGKYKHVKDRDYLVPWQDSTGQTLAERMYHGFTLDELSELFFEAGFTIIQHDRIALEGRSGNIVSILRKPEV